MNPEITALLAADGVVAARRHPHLARALNSCQHRGQLTRLLPGVYAYPDRAADASLRLRAITEYGNDLAVTAEWAASLSWWPDIDRPDRIGVAGPHDLKDHEGYAYEQRYIRPDLLTSASGSLLTVTALTVLDLITEIGPIAVDEALRRRATTIAVLERALRLTPGRRGNKLRRDVLEDSRDQPWSPLERDAHRRLRSSGIAGWVTNHPVRIAGVVYYLDVALPELRIALEFDGAEYHGTPEAFHGDRRRDQDLVAAGWRVARFTVKTMDRVVPVLRQLIRESRAA